MILVCLAEDSKKPQLKQTEKMGAGTEFWLYSIKKKKKKESGKQGPVLTTLHNYVLKNYVLHSE